MLFVHQKKLTRRLPPPQKKQKVRSTERFASFLCCLFFKKTSLDDFLLLLKPELSMIAGAGSALRPLSLAATFEAPLTTLATISPKLGVRVDRSTQLEEARPKPADS